VDLYSSQTLASEAVQPAGTSTVPPAARQLPDQDPKQKLDSSRFVERSTLGEGAMGAVVLAHDQDIGRNVAIKRVPPLTDKVQATRFSREVQALGKLEHPNIVPVYDVQRGEDKSFFLIMKHLEGESLEEIINHLSAGNAEYLERFSFSIRLRIAAVLIDAVGFAHERGFIHRDIKPANIMIGNNGEVSLIDWGLAKTMSAGADTTPESPVDFAATIQELPASEANSTLAGVRLGTPLYMSPEQARGDNRNVSETSDIYSLAVTIYEFLTLSHYLDGNSFQNVEQVLDAVVAQEARFAYWVRNPHQEHMPIEFAYWLKTALRKEQSERFASAKEMGRTLACIQDGEFDIVCPTTLARRVTISLGVFANRHPLLMIIGVGLTAATLVASAFIVVRALL